MTPTLEELRTKMRLSGGSLDLSHTGITALPDGLTVGGSLYLNGTGIPVIYDDSERGYKLRRIAAGSDGEWFVAGCRLFTSADAAIRHWGGANYPNPERGAAYVAAIRAASTAKPA